MAEPTIEVAVAHVSADGAQFLWHGRLAAGARVRDALANSGVLETLGQIDPANLDIGLHGRRVDADQVLANADRVEVYRPLRVEPKTARRRRAEVARGSGGKVL